MKHTGHAWREGSHALHEQRCLQGRNIKDDILEWQHLQIMFSPVVSWSQHTSPFFMSQHDSTSSTTNALSLIDSKALLSDNTIASFWCAALRHDWFSVSSLVKNCSNSILFFVACAICSSFCLSIRNTSYSTFFNIVLRCSCNNSVNFSFCCHH